MVLNNKNIIVLKNKFIKIYIHAIHVNKKFYYEKKNYLRLNIDANLESDSVLLHLYMCLCTNFNINIKKN